MLKIVTLTLYHRTPAQLCYVLLLLLINIAGCRTKPQPQLDRLRAEHPVPLQWTVLENGLSQTTLRFTHQDDGRNIVILALKADPQKFKFRLLAAPLLLNQPKALLTEMHDKSGALASINGGFFQPDFQPAGLVIIEGRELHPINPHGGSGLLRLSQGRPEIIWAKGYKVPDPPDSNILQAGPLLVEPGKKFGIKNNQNKIDSRTALCINDRHAVILLCTARFADDGKPAAGLDLYELAHVLYAEENQGGLGCQTALNLDGGPSTQMKISHPGLQMEVSSESKIPNAIGLFPR